MKELYVFKYKGKYAKFSSYSSVSFKSDPLEATVYVSLSGAKTKKRTMERRGSPHTLSIYRLEFPVYSETKVSVK